MFTGKSFAKKMVVVAAVCAAMLLCLSACTKEISVTIDDNGVESTVKVADGKTVADALQSAKIEVGENDVVEPGLDTNISDSTSNIVIKRCLTVTIIDDDETYVVQVFGGTVQDLLDEQEIVVSDNDEIDVALDSLVTDGLVITITRPEVVVAVPQTQPSTQQSATPTGRYVVSKTPVPNCNDESHGYYEILYSDGTMEYQEY